MCGILGAVASHANPLSKELRRGIRTNVDRIAHRGPDGCRHFSSDLLELVFTRLAIVGVADGDQPFISNDGNVVVAVNGEIFNHRELRSRLAGQARFKTHSDCEVVLHLYRRYGWACVNLLVGMFAIVIQDRIAGKTYLIRDRLGIKPLFLHLQDGVLSFASEIKALAGLPGRPVSFDWQAAFAESWLAGAPVLNSSSRPASFFTGIEQVAAGTVVELDTRTARLTEHCYWSLEQAREMVQHNDFSPAQFIEAYRHCLAQAVDDGLSGEVEVGLMLSGGIDSAALAALARERVGRSFHNFTVIARSTLYSGDFAAARMLASGLDMPLHGVCFPADKAAYFARLWPTIVELCETPYCGPEQLFKYGLYAGVKALRPSLKVMLSGQGSDEFNGGYSTLFGADWHAFQEALTRLYQEQALHKRGDFAADWNRHLGSGLFDPGWLAGIRPDANQLWTAYLQHKARDLQMYNLWHEDRLASGFGIENRVPFLDHRLVELTLAVPEALRAELFWDKSILRRAIAELLPAGIRDREKVPFFYGDGADATARLMLNMLQTDGQALLAQALETELGEVVNRQRLPQVLDQLAAGNGENWELLLRLVNMGLLARACKEWRTSARETTPAFLTLADLEQQGGDTELPAEFAAPDVRRRPHLVPALADNVSLLRPDRPAENHLLVLVNGSLAFEIDDPVLAEFLLQVDGCKTVAQILDQLQYRDETVHDLINQVLEARVLETT